MTAQAVSSDAIPAEKCLDCLRPSLSAKMTVVESLLMEAIEIEQRGCRATLASSQEIVFVPASLTFLAPAPACNRGALCDQ